VTTILEATPSSILDLIADVIEGGNAYASGTSYPGIPGLHSVLENVPTTLTADSNGTTTTVVADDLSDTEADRLVRSSDAPPIFLMCASGTALNKGRARKLASYSSGTYTTAAFAAATASADTFTVLEGFKRAPDTAELRDDIAGHDRNFYIAAIPGERLPLYGNESHQYSATLEITWRFLRYGRDRTVKDSLLDNLTRIRTILTRPSQAGGAAGNATLHALFAEGSEPEILVDDEMKVVVADRYQMQYSVPSDFS